MHPIGKSTLKGVAGTALFMLAVYGLSIPFGANTSGEVFFTFAEVMIGLVLMPLVIGTFVFTMYEFRELLARPKVDMYFESFTKEASVIKPKKDSKLSPLNLILYNTGDKVALWYMVVITVPLSLDSDPKITMGSEMGRRADIRNQGKLTQDDTDTTRVFRFRSEGETAVYTKFPLDFGMLRIMMRPDKAYEGPYEVTYTIANDWGEPVHGKFQLRVEEEK